MNSAKRKIKVLHTPLNVASFISETVKGLNRTEEIAARGVAYAESTSIYDGTEGIEIRRRVWGSNKNPFILARKVVFILRYMLDVMRADIVHWYWSNGIISRNLDLRIIKFFKKPLIVEWIGSEIRNPEIEKEVNKYYAEIFDKGYEYANYESDASSKAIQKKFAQFGAYPILTRGASIGYHVDKSLFKRVFLTRHRIDTKQYTPHYPEKNKKIINVVHSSTAKICKGTEYVLRAVDQLKEKYTFNFECLEKISREEARRKMEGCDIFLDQFILGGHGMATTEAMALGKPVVCFLHAKNLEELPSDCPIINATIEEIGEKLEKLLIDPEYRHNCGRKSRAYVEKYLDSEAVARELIDVYKTVLSDWEQKKMS